MTDEPKLFNLSDELTFGRLIEDEDVIIEADEIYDGEWLPMKSVQDFICRLKFDFCTCGVAIGEYVTCKFCQRIDKLAGKDLNSGIDRK
jgi:hypothetical protein